TRLPNNLSKNEGRSAPMPSRNSLVVFPPVVGRQANGSHKSQSKPPVFRDRSRNRQIVEREEPLKTRQRIIDLDQLEGGDALKARAKEKGLVRVGLGYGSGRP